MFTLLFISVDVHAQTTDEPVYHTVDINETLESIADNYDVSTEQIMAWNNLESEELVQGQYLEILSPGFYGRDDLIHEELQEVLEQYSDYPVYIYVESLENDKRSASIEGTTFVYGASLPKIVLAAFVLHQVDEGVLSWDDTYMYDDLIYEQPLSYAWGGSGIMQYESYRINEYTLEELTEMTLKNSDNMASNMLLYYVGQQYEEAFAEFTSDVYQASSFQLQITAKQMSQVMRYIYEHEDDSVKEMMATTDYDEQKLDVVADDTYQKIGGTNQVNHSTAIVEGDYDYVITVLTSIAGDDTISNIARDVNEVLSQDQNSKREETVDSYVPTIVRHDYPPEVHVHFQNILNQFADFPTLIQVDMLDEETQYARINKDLNFNNTPLGRVAVLAYTLNKIERGGVSWDQEFAYTDEIEAVRSNYAINMNGSSESDFTEGSFTLRELVAGTFENDMNAFYLLLHHVGFENTEDLNLFISNTTGGQFTLDIPTDDVHQFMRYIHDHSDQTMAEIWAEVEDVDSLLGSSDEIFLQLSGENDEVQYLTGIMTGDKSYVITIITEHLDTHETEGIAMRINENQSVEVDPHTYAFNELKDYSLARTKTVRYIASVNQIIDCIRITSKSPQKLGLR